MKLEIYLKVPRGRKLKNNLLWDFSNEVVKLTINGWRESSSSFVYTNEWNEKRRNNYESNKIRRKPTRISKNENDDNLNVGSWPHGRSQHFFRGALFQKFSKMHYFSIFFTKFNKPCVKFLRVWTQNAIWGNFLETFQKFS